MFFKSPKAVRQLIKYFRSAYANKLLRYINASDDGKTCEGAPVSAPVNTHYASSTECSTQCGGGSSDLGKSCGDKGHGRLLAASEGLPAVLFPCLVSGPAILLAVFAAAIPAMINALFEQGQNQSQSEFTCVKNIGLATAPAADFACAVRVIMIAMLIIFPATVGCSSDTCCRQRPNITSVDRLKGAKCLHQRPAHCRF